MGPSFLFIYYVGLLCRASYFVKGSLNEVCLFVTVGFAELHAEIEETIGDQNTMLLPYRDLPGYVFRCFFQDGEPIDVLLPLDVSL